MQRTVSSILSKFEIDSFVSHLSHFYTSYKLKTRLQLYGNTPYENGMKYKKRKNQIRHFYDIHVLVNHL